MFFGVVLGCFWGTGIWVFLVFPGDFRVLFGVFVFRYWEFCGVFGFWGAFGVF